jgi:hypothetical protein
MFVPELGELKGACSRTVGVQASQRLQRAQALDLWNCSRGPVFVGVAGQGKQRATGQAQKASSVHDFASRRVLDKQ